MASEESRQHAEFRAGQSPAGIGAAASYSGFQAGEHIWDCVVSDGREWHYIRMVGSGLGPYPDFSPEAIEQGIERFAGTLPSPDRIRSLLNANPLHIDGQGNVTD